MLLQGISIDGDSVAMSISFKLVGLRPHESDALTRATDTEPGKMPNLVDLLALIRACTPDEGGPSDLSSRVLVTLKPMGIGNPVVTQLVVREDGTDTGVAVMEFEFPGGPPGTHRFHLPVEVRARRLT